MVKKIFLFLIMFMPVRFKPFLYRHLCGYDISSFSKIGFSYIDATAVKIAEGSVIGHFTIVKGLDLLFLGNSSRIGRLNWITGTKSNFVKSKLELGCHSAITNRHYIDCINSITIGKFSTLAGIRTTLLTHSIDIYSNVQSSKPIVISDFCFIGTDSTILGGATLPNNSVLGAKSLLINDYSKPYSLYAGVPAEYKKRIDHNALYFARTKGVVD